MTYVSGVFLQIKAALIWLNLAAVIEYHIIIPWLDIKWRGLSVFGLLVEFVHVYVRGQPSELDHPMTWGVVTVNPS